MRLTEVGYRYGRRDPWVLRGVTVEVEPGQVVVIRGRNGAGKSTLLQLAAGVLTPSLGTVEDRPKRVGWVPERFPANQPFTTQGYLAAMAAVAGLRSAAATAAIDHWVQRLGLQPMRAVRLAELSKGTAQKVGLAQALLVRPELLILDEPWEGLDAPTRDLVPEIVHEITGSGGAVLVSDHLGETVRLPDAVTWEVSGGSVRATGDPATARWVIEVSVPAARGPAVVESITAAGHEIIRVRR